MTELLQAIAQVIVAIVLTAAFVMALLTAIYLISSATVDRDRCKACDEGRYDECPEARELMGMDD